MEENKFYININPAPAISTEYWYLICIRDLITELRKFEDVEFCGQERLDALKDTYEYEAFCYSEAQRKYFDEYRETN